MHFPTQGPVTLRTNLADSKMVAALKDGRVTSKLVGFSFEGPKSAPEGFKPMIRDGRFDAGEMAMVTFLQAKLLGKPLVLLPAVVLGRFQHGSVVSAQSLRPKELEGKCLAVRAYTQTTGVWARGILQHEYGVDLDRVVSGTFEDAHVAEYRDPPNVRRFGGEKTLNRMVTDGDVAAGILSQPDLPGVTPVIPQPEAAAKAWHRKTGVVPVNHMFAVSETLARTRPDVIAEIFRMLRDSKEAAGAAGEIDMLPLGVEANRASLAMLIDYALEQKIISRRLTVDELFDDATRHLGA